MKRHRVKTHPRAFTLVELLVVIAIVAMLVGLLVPALGRAREHARAVLCLSNLRQLSIAAQSYANDNDGHYPLAWYRQGLIDYSWDYIKTTDFSTGSPVVDVQPGLLWGGFSGGEVHQCPCYDGSANSVDDPYTGYNYNYSYIGHRQKIIGSRVVLDTARASQVKTPHHTALFGDGEYASGANKYMRSPWDSPIDCFAFRSSGTQGYRHLGKTHVAWCDGSATPWEERYTDTYSPDKDNITETTGFLSADNCLYDLD